MLSMRPIHRPVHDLAILPEVWDKMKPAEQAAARAQGKIRFPVSEKTRTTSLTLDCRFLDGERISYHDSKPEIGHSEGFYGHFQ